MKKFLIILIVFYLALVAFMPKDNLYFTLKNIAKNERVIITEDSLNNSIFSLQGDGVSILYDGIDSIRLEQFSIKPYLLYNHVEVKNVSASPALKKMFNFKAENIDISYAIWDFKLVNIEAFGDFGEVHGTLDLTTQTLKLLLEPTLRFEKSQFVRQYFKKSEEGYVYESKLK